MCWKQEGGAVIDCCHCDPFRLLKCKTTMEYFLKVFAFLSTVRSQERNLSWRGEKLQTTGSCCTQGIDDFTTMTRSLNVNYTHQLRSSFSEGRTFFKQSIISSSLQPLLNMSFRFTFIFIYISNRSLHKFI